MADEPETVETEPETDDDDDTAAKVTDEDLGRAAASWRELAPEGFRGLIDAGEYRESGSGRASALAPSASLAMVDGMVLVPSVAIEAKGGGGKSSKSKARKSKGGGTPGRKPFDESKHKRGTGGRFADKPGAGDDAPRKGRPSAGKLPKPADREPSPGSKVSTPEHLHSTDRERQVASALGGKYVGRRNGKDLPFDALVRDGTARHAVEVKTLSKGATDGIKVHADALVRKADYATRRPGRTVHTVAIDDRDSYGGGAFKANHSGHQLYYKRGNGRFALANMHKAKDMDEVNRLVRMKDADLPEAARAPKGWPPSGAERKRIEGLAEKDHAGRLARQRKARAEGRGWKPKPKTEAATP